MCIVSYTLSERNKSIIQVLSLTFHNLPISPYTCWLRSFLFPLFWSPLRWRLPPTYDINDAEKPGKPPARKAAIRVGRSVISQWLVWLVAVRPGSVLRSCTYHTMICSYGIIGRRAQAVGKTPCWCQV